MKTNIKALLALLLVLPACSGNPFLEPGTDGGDGGGSGGGGVPVTPIDPTSPSAPVVIPDNVKQNLTSAGLTQYTTDAESIKINLYSQDANDLEAVYARDTQFDVDGYQGYSYQETTSNRYVVALVREVGSAKAAIAVDAGQFGTYYGGGNYARADLFTRPAVGVGERFNYSGTYVGLQNVGPLSPDGPGGDLNPEIADRIEGRALITADFTNMAISGGVDNRVNVETGDEFPTIVLFSTDIAANGTFAGKVQRLDRGQDGTGGQFNDAGFYAGIFAGLNASEIATLMVFNPVPSPNWFEHGMVVLPNCQSGGGPACP
jgi:hypothetical protein